MRVEVTSVAMNVPKSGRCEHSLENFFERLIGYVGRYPWESWIETANDIVGKVIPFLVGAAGITTFFYFFIPVVKHDGRISEVMATLWILVGTFFAMCLTPRALVLMRSFIERREHEGIRPELASILRIVIGLGGPVLAIGILFQDRPNTVVEALVLVVIGFMAIVVLSRPGVAGLKLANPNNCVEELIGIVLFPIKSLLAFLTVILAVFSLGSMVYGIYLWTQNDPMASQQLIQSVAAPLVMSVTAYLGYVVITAGLDLIRAISTLPRKVDGVRSAIYTNLDSHEVECPECHKRCAVPKDVEEGRHLLCPYCSHKFEFHATPRN